MSLEGMWAVYFGDVAGPHVNSGVAVFETGRIFGGDSMMAYLGSYEATNNGITGSVKIWAYNPHIVVTTAFGKTGTPEGETLNFDATYDAEGNLVGSFAEQANPNLKIPAKLIKVAELP
jgi:hypothetical protein